MSANGDRGHAGFAASVVVENSASRPLTATIQSLLNGAVSTRLAVGYLFVEGLGPLVGALASVDRIDLLIGNVTNRLTDEQLREAGILPKTIPDGDDEFVADYRENRNRAAKETALNLRGTIATLPHSNQNRALIVQLAHWIVSGRLRVRLSTEHRLHAKVTLVQYPNGHEHAPGRAIVGTSNVTMPLAPGHKFAPSDLDILLEGEENYRILSGWFDRHWSEAQDFQRELFEELGRAWPLAEP